MGKDKEKRKEELRVLKELGVMFLFGILVGATVHALLLPNFDTEKSIDRVEYYLNATQNIPLFEQQLKNGTMEIDDAIEYYFQYNRVSRGLLAGVLRDVCR